MLKERKYLWREGVDQKVDSHWLLVDCAYVATSEPVFLIFFSIVVVVIVHCVRDPIMDTC